jgi:hypothetical protein
MGNLDSPEIIRRFIALGTLASFPYRRVRPRIDPPALAAISGRGLTARSRPRLALAERGMVSWAKFLTPAQVETIRA